MTQLTDAQRHDLRELLLAREREANTTIAAVRETLATPAGATGPEVRDSGEDSQAREGATRDITELARVEHELGEINAALVRMRDGSYGRCEDCDAPIPFERLKVQPTARLCVADATRREQRG